MNKLIEQVNSADLQIESPSHEVTSDKLSLVYSTLDIVKYLDIPRERFRDWMSREYIEPCQKAQGQGTKALFNCLDVYSIRLFQSLIEDRKLSRDEAGKLIKVWKESARFQDDMCGNYFDLVCFCQRKNQESEEVAIMAISLEGKEKSLIAEAIKWDSLLIINMRKIISDIDNKLKSAA